jgi:uncharacterized protein (TIGR02246 family)
MMIKSCSPMFVLHLIAVVFTFQAASVPKKPADNPAKTERPQPARAEKSDSPRENAGAAGEETIREIVQQFEEAFNSHDAKAVAEFFAPQAELINSEGQEVCGRDEIEKAFSNLFEMSPDAKVEVAIESIRNLSDSLIIEEGLSCLTYDEDGPREIARYTVIYAKEGDRWLMSYARDASDDESHQERIKELAWLIGDWVDESSDAVVMTTYHWTENRKAIEGEFVIHAAGYPALDGTHRIAWDPQARQLRSWVFDSEGGFASGLWSRTEDGWLVKLAGVLSDGRATSTTNKLEPQGSDHLSFQSVDRAIGGIALPDGDELSVVRHGPKPESLSEKRP